MTNLHHLPLDILFHIHHISQSTSLPYVNRSLHSSLAYPTTSRAVDFLVSRYDRTSKEGQLDIFLRYGICTLQVLKGIEDKWRKLAKRWEEINHPPVSSSPGVRRGEGYDSTIQDIDDHDHSTLLHLEPRADLLPPPPPPPTSPDNPYQPLICRNLPRRLFRKSPTVSPLLIHLYTYYHPHPNSYRGYALSRACLVGNYELIRFLLDKGADPGMKDGLAMMVAISKKDIKMVKMLFEKGKEIETMVDGDGDGDGDVDVESTMENHQDGMMEMNCALAFTTASTTTTTTTTNKRKRITRFESNTAKRLKTEEPRMTMTPELMKKVMSSGSREIIDYFVNERGCIPSLGSIMALR